MKCNPNRQTLSTILSSTQHKHKYAERERYEEKYDANLALNMQVMF